MGMVLATMILGCDGVDAPAHRWEVRGGAAGLDDIRAVWPAPPDRVVVAGRAAETDETAPVPRTDAWVAEIDGSGAVVWEHTFGGPGYDGAWGVVPAPDGDWWVVGSTRASPAPPHPAEVGAWMRRLAADGELRWHRPLALGFEQVLAAAPLDPAADGGGGVVLVGNTGAGGRVVAVDEAGEVLWERDLGALGWTWLVDVAVAGGDVFAVGAHRDACGLVRLDRDGEGVAPYLGPRGCIAHGVSVLPDGDVVIAGRRPAWGRRRTYEGVAWRLAADGDDWRPVWARRVAGWSIALDSAVVEGALAVVGGGEHRAGVALLDPETGRTRAQRRFDVPGTDELVGVVGTGGAVVAVGRHAARAGSADFERWAVSVSARRP